MTEERYGVTPQTIWRAVNGETWKHVEEPTLEALA